MGECTSRPSNQEIQEHIDESNSKNDANFRYFPFQCVTKDELKNEKEIQILEAKLNIFERKKSEIISKLDSKIYDNSIVPELNIEIQKGIDFYNAGICLLEGKPFVLVSLEPNGPKFETFESDIFKPYWYRFFQIKQIIHYNKIVFQVFAKPRYGKNKSLGTCEVKINDLSDQTIKEDWFELKSDLKLKPSIRIRIQHIYDEKKLLKEMLQSIQEKIEIVEGTIESLQKFN